MIKLLIFSVFFLSSSFCDEHGVRFINDVTNDDVMDIEFITDFSEGGFNYSSNFSGRISTKYQGKDDNHKFIQTWSNIVSTYKRNDDVKINHSAQKLNGTRFILIADSTGEFTRDGLDDNAREMEEENRSFMFFSGQGNMLYPFGSDSLFKIGDTWVTHKKEHLDEFPGFEEAVGDVEDETIYTFDKIKTKKGKKIAYISAKGKIFLNMTSVTWDESWEMDVVGVLKSKIQYDLTNKKVIKCRMRGSIKGNGRDLIDDASISFNQNIDMICKTKY